MRHPARAPLLLVGGDAVFQPLAQIDLSNPNAAEEAFKFAGGLGEGITTFVTNNRDDVLAASDTSFTKKLERIEGNFNATEEEISTINGQIETEFDSKVGDYKANLEKEIATLEEEAKTITDEAKKKQKKAKALSFKEELALYRGGIDKVREQMQAQFDANNRAMETANTSQGSFGGSSAAVRGETQIAFQRAYQVHLASCMKGRGYEEVRETK